MGNKNPQMLLNHCFQYYESSLSPIIEKATCEFLAADFNVRLVSASYEPAFFWKDNDYFVTQINHTGDFFLVLKISNAAANVMFSESLGERQRDSEYLCLKEITELEARILTAYNEFIYKNLTELLLDKKEIKSILHTLKNEKTLYLTFYVDANNEKEAGRIILSLPQFIFRKTHTIPPPESPLEYDFFNNSIVETGVLIGKTRAKLNEVKALELEDIIILEQSDLYQMYLKDYDCLRINVNPSHSLVLDFEEENGDDDIVNETKKSSVNIWDSLEVDVHASFEKVKMKLGDLREITEGLVVDVASMSNNKVYIEVENNLLATGELVIIGDKYGVKITEICKEAKRHEIERLEENAEVKHSPVAYEMEDESVDEYEEQDEDLDEEIDEDIDDSDFEL